MKYVSLFAGIGGFDLALNRLGHTSVYTNEWDKYAAQTYEKNFGHKPDTTSITDVTASSIPKHDLLVGGFPCQAFSVAGKRRGFEEVRGTLFFDIARILKHHQTKYFILENVKGLLSHDSGRTFRVIIKTLAELGYDLQWQVLNSKNFGVPQNRERVFIIGHLRGIPRPEIFPLRESNDNDSVKNGNAAQLPNTLSANYWKGVGASRPFIAQRIPLKFLNRNQRNIEGDYAYTVDSMNTGGVMQDMKIRRLTPIECERLQGFPDNWTNVTQSSIMEVCVSINPVIEKLLPTLDTVSCTINAGKDTVRQIQSLEKELPVTFVIDQLLLESSAIDTIKAGKDTVILFNQKGTLHRDTKTQLNHTEERMDEKSTYKSWSIILDENLPKERLSTILTSIKEIMTSPIFTSVNQEQNIIGYIIRYNSQLPSYTERVKYPLTVTNIKTLMSDTQRYKQLGNAVTVNVVEAIAGKL